MATKPKPTPPRRPTRPAPAVETAPAGDALNGSAGTIAAPTSRDRKHTAGPWDVILVEPGRQAAIRKFDTIALMNNMGDFLASEFNANAHAIGASTLMLDLLIDLEADLTIMGAQGNPLKRIRETIAIATGQKSYTSAQTPRI